jgi:prephenate dehydratase
MKHVLFRLLPSILLNKNLAQAAHNVFGAGAIYEEQSSISGYQCLLSIYYSILKHESGVFAILSKNIPLGIVPHENSTFGIVTETYDLLRSTFCFVCGEVTLMIEHGLLVKRGVKLHEIQRVFSHEQVRSNQSRLFFSLFQVFRHWVNAVHSLRKNCLE